MYEQCLRAIIGAMLVGVGAVGCDAPAQTRDLEVLTAIEWTDSGAATSAGGETAGGETSVSGGPGGETAGGETSVSGGPGGETVGGETSVSGGPGGETSVSGGETAGGDSTGDTCETDGGDSGGDTGTGGAAGQACSGHCRLGIDPKDPNKLVPVPDLVGGMSQCPGGQKCTFGADACKNKNDGDESEAGECKAPKPKKACDSQEISSE